VPDAPLASGQNPVETMNPEPAAKVEKMPSAIRQIIQRLRWMVAAPVLRPILLQEWTETSDNATRSAKWRAHASGRSNASHAAKS